MNVRSDLVNNIPKRLDFHPLSITLLATVAHRGKWGADRLARELERCRTGVLQTEHNKSLAATIEPSLTSSSFQELGPDARALLGAVAFFPQGVDKNNLDRSFPAIANRTSVVGKFCILSLTYRTNGFGTMLVPPQDYLTPEDSKLSPLLCTIEDCYFTRMSVDLGPDRSGFGETGWITSEDANAEHLLDIFTSINDSSDDAWDACTSLQAEMLVPPLTAVGNHMERKRPLIRMFKLER